MVAQWWREHPGEQIPDGHVFTQPWPAGPKGGRRDQVINYQYRHDRARRTLGVSQASPGQRGLLPDARMRLARLMPSPPRRTATAALRVSGLSGGHTWPASQRASWRPVPAGQVIRIRDGDVRREFLAVAYVQSADGARFTTAGWPFGPFTSSTAADDRDASYQISFPARCGRTSCCCARTLCTRSAGLT